MLLMKILVDIDTKKVFLVHESVAPVHPEIFNTHHQEIVAYDLNISWYFFFIEADW